MDLFERVKFVDHINPPETSEKPKDPEAPEMSNAPIIRSKSQKCNFGGCKKKLSVTDTCTPCKCKKCFCTDHRFSESHRCTYDFRTESNKELERRNPKVVGAKIETI